MPYNPIYDGQFDYPEKIYNLSYSPYINSDIDMPTPLFSPDKKLTSGVGFGESSYDTEESAMSVTNPSFINRNRAYQEPEYVKGFNSIVGGVVSGSEIAKSLVLTLKKILLEAFTINLQVLLNVVGKVTI